MRVIAWEILHDAVTFEDEEVVHNLVHEVAVVRDDDDAASEVLQVLLQNLQRSDVEIVRGLVEDEEIGALHEYSTEVEPALLAPRKLVDVVLLLLGREHEMLEELHGRELPSASPIDVFSGFADCIYHLHLLVELHSVLTIVAETDSLTHDKTATIGLHQSEQHLHESALSCAVIADDAELFVTREVIVEVLEQDKVSVSLAHILGLEYLAADVGRFHLEPDLLFLDTAMSLLLQLVEGFLAIPCFMSSGLRHSSHPVEFRPVEVRCPSHLSPSHFQALFTMFEEVGIVALIGVDRFFIELEDDGTDAVEEVAVVRDHQEGDVGAREIVLEPLYHLKVEVVRRFIKDEEVGLHDKRIGEGDTLQLPS